MGLSAKSVNNRRFLQLLKQRSPENDNEYVWFTRDVHDNFNSDQAIEQGNEKHFRFDRSPDNYPVRFYQNLIDNENRRVAPFK